MPSPRLALLGLIAATLATPACFDWAPQIREQRATVRTRAAFDMACSASAIELTTLDHTGLCAMNDGEQQCLGSSIGAIGCGRRAVYNYDWRNGTWTLNASPSNSGGAAAVP